MFAKRMQNIESSGIRKMFEMASKMKNPINLSLGLPDFDVPESVKAAAIEAIQNGQNQYTVTRGIPALQEAIKQTLQNENIPAEDSMVISGASGGLILALMVLADEDTEVFIPDPAFVCYKPMVNLVGAKIRWIDTDPEFKLTAQMLADSLALAKKENPNIKRRILIFNSPVNPTGIAYTANEIKALAQTSHKLGLQVISDEVYDKFCYDFAHESWLKHDPTALLIRTFGKTWAVTGWRVGYAAGPKDLIEQMVTLQQFSFVCVPTPAQYGCVAALKTDMSHVIDEYRHKRDLAYSILSKAFEIKKPQGAFYVYVKAPNGDGAAFLKKCIENEILIVPGKTFSQKDSHFRVSYALDNKTLKLGLEKLASLTN